MSQSGDEEEEETDVSHIDFSVIRTAIKVRGKMLDNIMNSIHYGSPEVRDLLLEECDLIIECKVCRNLFRALPNFIAHKRIYCLDSAQRNVELTPGCTQEEIITLEPEAPPEVNNNHELIQTIKTMESQEDNSHASESEESVSPASSSSVKLSSLENTINQVRSGSFQGTSPGYRLYTEMVAKLQQEDAMCKRSRNIRLTPILTNPNAVKISVRREEKRCVREEEEVNNVQSEIISVEAELPIDDATKVDRGSNNLDCVPTKSNSGSVKSRSSDSEQMSKGAGNSGIETPMEVDVEPLESGMRASAAELSAILSPRREVSSTIRVVHNTPYDYEHLICLRCNAKFSSTRTLIFHIKNLHSAQRFAYTCPVCDKQFLQRWGIHRHLTSVHYTNNKQLFRLKKKIQRVPYSGNPGEKAPLNINVIVSPEKENKICDVSVNIPRCDSVSVKNSGKDALVSNNIKNIDIGTNLSTTTPHDSDSQEKSHAPPCQRRSDQRKQKYPQKLLDNYVGYNITNSNNGTTDTTDKSRAGEITQGGSLAENTNDFKGVICYYCNKRFKSKSSLNSHKRFCETRPRNVKGVKRTDKQVVEESQDENTEQRNKCHELPQVSTVPSDANIDNNDVDEVQVHLDTSYVNGGRMDVNPDTCFGTKNEDSSMTNTASLSPNDIDSAYPDKIDDARGDCLSSEPVQLKKSPLTGIIDLPATVKSGTSKAPCMSGSKQSPKVQMIEQIWVSKSPGQPAERVRSNRVYVVENTNKSTRPRCLDSKKIDGIVNERQLLCNNCGLRFKCVSNLRRHAIRHLGWKRFRCNHCQYKCYNRSECKSHVFRIHNVVLTSEAEMDQNVTDLSRVASIVRAQKKQQTMSQQLYGHGMSKSTRTYSTLSKHVHSNKLRKPVTNSTCANSSSISMEILPSDAHNQASPNVSSSTKPPSSPAKQSDSTSTITSSTNPGFNISTRNSPRRFDLRPYVPFDQMTVLFTRKGYYPKVEKLRTRPSRRSEPTLSRDAVHKPESCNSRNRNSSTSSSTNSFKGSNSSFRTDTSILDNDASFISEMDSSSNNHRYDASVSDIDSSVLVDMAE